MTNNQISTQATDPIAQAIELAHKAVPSFLKEKNKKLLEHSEQIKQVIDLLEDEESRKQYTQELAYQYLKTVDIDLAQLVSPFKSSRLQAAFENLPILLETPNFPVFKVHAEEISYLRTMIATTFLLEQYRYKNILNVEQGDIFLDCGACFGDTTLWAYRKGAAKVYSFEPGESNLNILKLNLEANNRDLNFIIPTAVGLSNTTLKFISGIGMAGAAHIATDEEIQELYNTCSNKEQADEYIQCIECVNLDDWCAKNAVEPTFIKMDVEGAELDALKGASETIKRLKPKLTICLYHKLEDMWEIPLYLHQIVPEYKFYCHKHHMRNEFVLYAVAK